MNKLMSATLLASSLLVLAGCDQAEKSAKQLLGTATESAKQALDETHDAATKALDAAAQELSTHSQKPEPKADKKSGQEI